MTRFEIAMGKRPPEGPITIEPSNKAKETMGTAYIPQFHVDPRRFHILREIPQDLSDMEMHQIRTAMTSELVNQALRENCFNITFSENPNYIPQRTLLLVGELIV
jgi:hypothetical protein